MDKSTAKGIILAISFEDFIIFPLIFVLLFLSLRICYRKIARAYGTTDQCPNKDCIRCRRRQFKKDELLEKLSKFREKEDIDVEELERLAKSITETDNSNHRSVSGSNNKQKPTVLHLQGLQPCQPFHPIDSELNFLIDSKQLDVIEEELLGVIVKDFLWSKNDVPTGSWKLFYFFNQGKQQTENCLQCPKTTETILKIPSFMKSCSFGNAAFSVLLPGSNIPPHNGATNARLRCHLTLLAGNSCSIRVGSETASYEKRKLVLFDDSFAHSVSHDSTDQDIRVVLLVDIWHPSVTHIEKQAIETIYTF